MKILLYTDVHWSTTASLIQKRGTTFSLRLEHLIESMNKVNELALENNCDYMVCAGDFMDHSYLSDEEITALKQIKWNNLQNFFLCGNHESSVCDLRFNSLKALEDPRHKIITKPELLKDNACNILFLPYISETDRKPLKDYIDEAGIHSTDKPLIIISHNDIAGINYAGFESKIGFSVQEISNNCDLYLNGHLHNSEWVSNKILNIGSLTAHNFTNDSLKYKYGVWILDTETRQLDFIENTSGFNFYKLDIFSEADLAKIDKCKKNAVVSIRCYQNLLAAVQNKLASVITLDYNNILESKIITVKNPATLASQVQETKSVNLQIDYYAKFIEFCKANIEATKILDEELNAVCK